MVQTYIFSAFAHILKYYKISPVTYPLFLFYTQVSPLETSLLFVTIGAVFACQLLFTFGLLTTLSYRYKGKS